MNLQERKTHVAVVSVEWDVVDLIESIPELSMAGFFDPNPDLYVGEFNYFGSEDAWKKTQALIPGLKVVLALDFPSIRAHLFEFYGERSLLTLISPHAYVSHRSPIGVGSIIQRGVTVMPNVKIGNGCKLNINASVHHDVQIGHFSTLAPGSTLLGRVIVEDQVYVGAGAIIRQRCRIGRGATIGAGAVVVRDVPPGATVVGVPANRHLH